MRLQVHEKRVVFCRRTGGGGREKRKALRRHILRLALILMLSAAGLSLYTRPAYAASVEEWMVCVYGLDSSGSQVYYTSNGVMFNGGDYSLIVAPGVSDWDACQMYVVQQVSTGNQVEIALNSNDTEAGAAFFQTGESIGGATTQNLRSVSDLSTAETVYCYGLDFSLNGETIADFLQKESRSVAGLSEQDGLAYVELDSAVNEYLAGSIVLDENYNILGFLSCLNSRYFLAIDNIFDLSGSTSGSASGGSTDGGTGESGDNGESPDVSGGTESTQSAAVTNPLKGPYFVSVVLIAFVAFFVSLILYKNDEVRVKTMGLDEFELIGNGGIGGAGAAEESGSASLYCVSGALQGKTCPIGPASLLIGRNAECGLKYPGNTPGVSGRHCKIKAENSRIILTDLQSSYGTFLENGTKLAPNVPYQLQKGDAFYLAERKNMFRVM